MVPSRGSLRVRLTTLGERARRTGQVGRLRSSMGAFRRVLLYDWETAHEHSHDRHHRSCHRCDRPGHPAHLSAARTPACEVGVAPWARGTASGHPSAVCSAIVRLFAMYALPARENRHQSLRRVGRQLGAVVAADERRCGAALGDEPFQGGDRLVGVDAAVALECQCLADVTRVRSLTVAKLDSIGLVFPYEGPDAACDLRPHRCFGVRAERSWWLRPATSCTGRRRLLI